MELGLVGFLRAAWIAATFPVLIALLPFSGLNWFRRILLGFAKRGKIMESSSHKLTVPQRFFLHFYIIAVFWTTLLLLIMWIYAYRMAPLVSDPFLDSTFIGHLTGGSHIFSLHRAHLIPVEHRYSVWCCVFMLLLLEVQVIRRLIETIYVFTYSSSARMHIFGYLAGLFFYTVGPLSICSSFAHEVFKFVVNQSAEYIVKGRTHMPVVEFSLWAYVNPLLKLGWCQWIGASIFLFGWIHQRRCHAILGSLREYREQGDEYVIPHGDWFELVSSPHYLAEIVIYAGVLVASGGADTTIWLLFGFVVANLVFAAGETHSFKGLKGAACRQKKWWWSSAAARLDTQCFWVMASDLGLFSPSLMDTPPQKDCRLQGTASEHLRTHGRHSTRRHSPATWDGTDDNPLLRTHPALPCLSLQFVF